MKKYLRKILKYFLFAIIRVSIIISSLLSNLKFMNFDLNELKSLYIFEWLESEVIVSILKNSKIRSYKSSEAICREWDKEAKEAFIIVSGNVNVYIDAKFVKKLSKWDIFWEYALIREEERTATVVAETDTTCIILNLDSLVKMASDDIKLNKIMISRINENIEKKLWIFKDYDF